MGLGKNPPPESCFQKPFRGFPLHDNRVADFEGGIETTDTWSLPLKSPHPSTHSFSQNVFTEHLLGARHVARMAGVSFLSELTINWETPFQPSMITVVGREFQVHESVGETTDDNN